MRSSNHEPTSIELPHLPGMDRVQSGVKHVRDLFSQQGSYQPLDTQEDGEINNLLAADGVYEGDSKSNPYSWVEYSVFLLLGIAMLWAWNMFLAAAPYFQHRFESDQWIRSHFQSAEISVSTVANLSSMIVLTKLQKNASYPRRIAIALLINIVCFTLLALSTLFTTSAGVYFGFLMIMVLFASMSTGFIQNGLFAYVSGFGKTEYTQAIMTGQAVAGVLPPLAQIFTVLAVPTEQKHTDPDGPDEPPAESHKSAFIYFLTATAVSGIALLAFAYLHRRHSQTHPTPLENAIPKSTSHVSEASALNDDDHVTAHAVTPAPPEISDKPSIPLMTLFRKIPFLASGIFICFGVTMVFPAFTASILSVRSPEPMAPALFIPLAFLVWNLGDFFGRLSTLYKPFGLYHYPFALFCLAMARLVFVPLYLLCNVNGHGAVVQSDLFYLFVVQALFGLSNGYLGSQCMVGAGEWVKDEEKEATGAFMGLCLVSGLTVGSLLSFTIGSG